jgi:hypothetical protein
MSANKSNEIVSPTLWGTKEILVRKAFRFIFFCTSIRTKHLSLQPFKIHWCRMTAFAFLPKRKKTEDKRPTGALITVPLLFILTQQVCLSLSLLIWFLALALIQFVCSLPLPFFCCFICSLCLYMNVYYRFSQTLSVYQRMPV